MDGDAANARFGAACLEPPVEVARLEGRTGAGREDEAGVRPVGPVRGPSLGLVLRAHAQSRHAYARQWQRGVGCLSLGLAAQELAADALKLPANVEFRSVEVGSAPRQADDLAFALAEDEDQHICRI